MVNAVDTLAHLAGIEPRPPATSDRTDAPPLAMVLIAARPPTKESPRLDAATSCEWASRRDSLRPFNLTLYPYHAGHHGTPGREPSSRSADSVLEVLGELAEEGSHGRLGHPVQ